MEYKTVNVGGSAFQTQSANLMLKEYRLNADAQPSKILELLFRLGGTTLTLVDIGMSSGLYPTLHGRVGGLPEEVWVPLGKRIEALVQGRTISPECPLRVEVTTISCFCDDKKKKWIYFPDECVIVS